MDNLTMDNFFPFTVPYAGGSMFNWDKLAQSRQLSSSAWPDVDIGPFLASVTGKLPCYCDSNRTTTETLIADGFLSLISLFTFLVNAAFIFTVWLNRPLHTYTNKLLLSNAVIDLLVGCTVMPFHIIKHMQANCWQFARIYCQLAQSLDIHLTTTSIFHLTGVAAERYFRIVRVYWYERWAKRLVPICIALFWLLPIPSTFAGVLSDLHLDKEFTRKVTWTFYGNNNTALTISQMRNTCGKENPQERPCRCSFWGSADFTIGTTFFQFILPILVMIYFYVRIFIVAYHQAKKMQNIRTSVAFSSNISLSHSDHSDSLKDQHSPGHNTSHGRASVPNAHHHHATARRAILFSKDIRMVRLCALVFLIFVICWTPYFLMMLMEAYCVGNNYVTDQQIFEPTEVEAKQQLDLSIGFYFCLWLGFANSFLNPLVIFCMEKNYRNGFRIMMHRKVGCLARFLRITNPRNRPTSMRLTSLTSVMETSEDPTENSTHNQTQSDSNGTALHNIASSARISGHFDFEQ